MFIKNYCYCLINKYNNMPIWLKACWFISLMDQSFWSLTIKMEMQGDNVCIIHRIMLIVYKNSCNFCNNQYQHADIMNASLNPDESTKLSAIFVSTSASMWSEINCNVNGTCFAEIQKSKWLMKCRRNILLATNYANMNWHNVYKNSYCKWYWARLSHPS